MSHLILCSIGNFFAVLSRVPFIASAQQQAHVQTAPRRTLVAPLKDKGVRVRVSCVKSFKFKVQEVAATINIATHMLIACSKSPDIPIESSSAFACSHQSRNIDQRTAASTCTCTPQRSTTRSRA
jgi:hypothetical protein